MLSIILSGVAGVAVLLSLGLSWILWKSQVKHNNLQFELAKASNQQEVEQRNIYELKQQLKISLQQEQNLMAQKTQLEKKLSAMEVTVQEKQQRLAEQEANFAKTQAVMKTEFQNLANQILEEKSQRFNQQNQSSLNELLKPFREQIDSFQKRVNEIHDKNLQGNANLEAEIKKMCQLSQSMSQEASNLTSALKGNKKILGNWGEMQLEQSLQSAGLVKDVHYQAQPYFVDENGKKQYPDFIVQLPDGKNLIIDSKMSLIAYEQAVTAQANNDEVSRNLHLNEHCQALRKHIDDLNHKNYSGLKNMESPNFVLMFIALEPAYIEALKHDPSLFDYGYQKNVILVSHTTLMPILRTVANLWRLEKSNREFAEISNLAGDLYNQLCVVAERFKKLGNSLDSTTKQYNDTVTAFIGKQGLVGKVERFKTISTKANKEMAEINVLHSESEKTHLLDLLTHEQSAN